MALTAGEPDQLQVQSILDERGLAVASTSSARHIGSVAALMSVYRKHGPEVLRYTLDTVVAAWEHEGGDRWDSGLMGGLGRVIAQNLTKIDPGRLNATLRKRLPASWKALLVARAGGTGGSGSRPVIASQMFAEGYNTGLRVTAKKLKA